MKSGDPGDEIATGQMARAVIDQEGVIADVNISLCRLLEYSKNELTGKKFSELEDIEQVRADPLRFDLQESGQDIIKERRLKKRDGGFVELELNVKVIDGNRFLAIGRDLRDLRSVQKQIALSESTLRGAFEHSAIGMALVSPQGKWLR
ncbi:PAS domain S-box protein, partial [Ostertagia ostertagi]